MEVLTRGGIGGQEIRTTSEHPFFVRGKGWVATSELTVDDKIASEDGAWVPIETVEDTGTDEVVFNFRVAEFATYFVGCDEWGFSIWAHNLCIALGLSKHLIAFKNNVAPEALIYPEWVPPFVFATGFQGKFFEVVLQADTIYVNLQGIPDVPTSVGHGKKGPNPHPPIPNQGDNITNWELFQLSVLSATMPGFAAKIRWYNNTTNIATPENYAGLYKQ